MYEPAEECGSGRCLMHPLESQDFSRSVYSDYAADLSIAFAYHKCLDDWQDDKSLTAKAGVELLKGPYQKARERIPEECEAIETALADISSLQDAHDTAPDDAAKRFGMLMGTLFSSKQEHWAPLFFDFGYHLGRFIYLMDAAIDYEDDIKSGNYNPFKELECEPLDMRILLEGIMGEAVLSFEKLPLVQDIHLLRSILYAGVWQKFNTKYKEDGEAARSSAHPKMAANQRVGQPEGNAARSNTRPEVATNQSNTQPEGLAAQNSTRPEGLVHTEQTVSTDKLNESGSAPALQGIATPGFIPSQEKELHG